MREIGHAAYLESMHSTYPHSNRNGVVIIDEQLETTSDLSYISLDFIHEENSLQNNSVDIEAEYNSSNSKEGGGNKSSNSGNNSKSSITKTRKKQKIEKEEEDSDLMITEEARQLALRPLQAHTKEYLKNAKLSNGVDNIRVGCIIATVGSRKNSTLWFGRVVAMYPMQQVMFIKWLHRFKTSSKYYYISDNINMVHYEAVIANSIEFQAKFKKTGVMWKLLTPYKFIQNLQNIDGSLELTPVSNLTPELTQKTVDIACLEFTNATEFAEFIYKYKIGESE